MGGADHSNQNINVLKVLENFSNITINIVTTTANKHLKKLITYVKNKSNITLHINTNKIAYLMNQADFAIITPSVTLNEVFYMQLPFIAIKTASNQDQMYDYLIENGYRALKEFDAKILNKMLEERDSV